MRSELITLRRDMADWMSRHPGESVLDYCMRLAVTAVVLLFPATGLLLDRADSYSLLLLLITGMAAWTQGRFHTGFGRQEWLYASVFLLFFSVGVLAFACGHETDYGFRLLGRYLRLLLVLPALMALRRYRPPALLVWAGLGLGALALGVDAVLERALASDIDQPMGDTNVAILFGDMALLTAFGFAAGYVYVDGRLPRLGPKLLWLGILAGMTACFLSGARGAWLAIPVLLVLFLTCSHLVRPRSVLLGGIVIVMLFTALYTVPETKVRVRLDNAVEQLRTYVYVKQSLENAPAPICLDDPILLKAWVAEGVRSSDPEFHINVVSAPVKWRQQLLKNGCVHATMLRLTNVQSHDPNWIYLPRAIRGKHGAAVANLLVSGAGWMHLGVGPRSERRIFPPLMQSVELHTYWKRSGRLAVVVAPQSAIYMVPLELYTGEYRYALLQTSVGQRLEMWHVAWRLFLKAPVVGVGTGGYMSSAQKLVDEGTAPPITSIYDHPHNEFLDALSSRGLVGLAALLLLFGVPAWLFARGLGSRDPARMGASLGGLLVCVGFPVFGLSETMLVHSVTLGWYVIMTAIFMATAESNEVEGRGE
ncbi:MAG TPA: O-antigen ligase family protein [Gammaproteobacteria bacterium]|nr:O-antigen ligase family protein [Gammaproteobacteria bacterium]